MELADADCEIVEILEHRVSKKGALEYHVKYTKSRADKLNLKDSWEKESNLVEECYGLLQRYKKAHGLEDKGEEDVEDVVNFGEIEDTTSGESEEEAKDVKQMELGQEEAEEVTEEAYVAKWLEDNKTLGYNQNLVRAVAKRLYQYYDTLTGELELQDLIANYDLILDAAVEILPEDEQKPFQKKFASGDMPQAIIDRFALLERIQKEQKLSMKQQRLLVTILRREVKFEELEEEEVDQIQAQVEADVAQLVDTAATDIRTKALEMLSVFGVELLSQETEDIKIGDLMSFISIYGTHAKENATVKKGLDCLMEALKKSKELRDIYTTEKALYDARAKKKTARLEKMKVDAPRTQAVSLRPGMRQRGGRRLSRRRLSRRRFSPR